MRCVIFKNQRRPNVQRMMQKQSFLLICNLLALIGLARSAWPVDAKPPQYLGPDTCKLCHKDIGATQSQTAMANTWQGAVASWLTPGFNARVAEDLRCDFAAKGNAMLYSVELENHKLISLPVSISMGGKRHGLGFLASIREVDGVPLARTTLVQARYAWSAEKQRLLLAPGCAATKPTSMEAALGVVLSPTFESRCLSCHGEPSKAGTGTSGGVHCESCHGPGSAHMEAVGSGAPKQGVINPKRLTNEESIAVCARCHVGLARFADPSPDDLLIANQATAITRSECFLQSGKAFNCTTCHNPHQDLAGDAKQTAKVCLSCHGGSGAIQASVCPINKKTGCIGCHMPSVEMGALHLVDHSIRVHPEQTTSFTSPSKNRELRSHVRPVSEYLRLLTVTSQQAIGEARARLNQGDSFYEVAKTMSVDSSAPIGGYMGMRRVSDLSPALQKAASDLDYGENSGVLEENGRWSIVGRLPRDFRWQAEQMQSQAEKSLAEGSVPNAIRQSQQALMIYPHFLRALLFIGVTFAQNGNPSKGVQVLSTATKLYPDDAGAQFALGTALDLTNNRSVAIEAYRRAIALDPDFVGAYANLGYNLSLANEFSEAVKTFREGLQIDPLSAELNYDLGVAFTARGDQQEGSRFLDLARKLDSALVQRREAQRVR
jgi:tetratricopeptide (TPR) repeat protein